MSQPIPNLETAQTAFLKAVQDNDEASVKSMLEKNHLLANTRELDGSSFILPILFQNHKKMAALIGGYATNLDINEASAIGRTSRVLALCKENLQLVRSTDSYGFAPLHWAAHENQIDVTKLLLDYGADVHQISVGKIIASPLQSALDGRAQATIQLLLARGARVNDWIEEKTTALHVACMLGDIIICRSLVSYGAKLDAHQKHDNKTPLQVAVDGGHSELVDYLKDMGALV